MSRPFAFVDPLGQAVIGAIESVVSLGALVALVSAIAALVAVYLVCAQRSFVRRLIFGFAAGALALNTATPWITVNMPWFSHLPLAISMLSLLLLAACRSRP